jgi:hypothetical protein
LAIKWLLKSAKQSVADLLSDGQTVTDCDCLTALLDIDTQIRGGVRCASWIPGEGAGQIKSPDHEFEDVHHPKNALKSPKRTQSTQNHQREPRKCS